MQTSFSDFIGSMYNHSTIYIMLPCFPISRKLLSVLNYPQFFSQSKSFYTQFSLLLTICLPLYLIKNHLFWDIFTKLFILIFFLQKVAHSSNNPQNIKHQSLIILQCLSSLIIINFFP